ncbi:hypothetical protein CK203_104466 [Vitis vinifera]|uniref:Uncharacterized protein n=1 Tax=Vitis vinifera TaxID=29760 RepID=A0A438EAB6_VITVI|nr:hypothetical protein CK203_104466 [Vitis vinifera]
MASYSASLLEAGIPAGWLAPECCEGVDRSARSPGGLGNRAELWAALRRAKAVSSIFEYLVSTSANALLTFRIAKKKGRNSSVKRAMKRPNATSLPVRRCNSFLFLGRCFHDCLDLIRANLYPSLADHKTQKFASTYAKGAFGRISFMPYFLKRFEDLCHQSLISGASVFESECMTLYSNRPYGVMNAVFSSSAGTWEFGDIRRRHPRKRASLARQWNPQFDLFVAKGNCLLDMHY